MSIIKYIQTISNMDKKELEEELNSLKRINCTTSEIKNKIHLVLQAMKS